MSRGTPKYETMISQQSFSRLLSSIPYFSVKTRLTRNESSALKLLTPSGISLVVLEITEAVGDVDGGGGKKKQGGEEERSDSLAVAGVAFPESRGGQMGDEATGSRG